MKLTEKCKEDFEVYFLERFEMEKWSDLKPCFYCLDNSLKYGVYVDFFDSVGLTLLINTETYDCWWSTILEEDKMSPYFESCAPIETTSRKEARTEAIKKANEIYNQNK